VARLLVSPAVMQQEQQQQQQQRQALLVGSHDHGPLDPAEQSASQHRGR
jgi:hypothetical protein